MSSEEGKNIIENKEEIKQEENKEELTKQEDKIENEIKQEENKTENKEEDKKEDNKEENIKEENKEDIKDEKEDEKEEIKKNEDEKDILEEIKKIKYPELKPKLLQLNFLNNEKYQIETKYAKEYDKIKCEYDNKYLEIYSQIQKIINGESKEKVSNDEIKKYLKENESIDENLDESKIEDYWEKVIINSKYFTITDKDKIILKHLKKVWMEKIDNNINDFIINFQFENNEYFSNDILYKKYYFPENEESKPKKIEVCKINWTSQDKDPSIEKINKKIKKGKKVTTKTITEDVDSFFSLFKNIECNSFTVDECIFFREDLFNNQLEYYLNIRVGLTYHADDLKDLDYDEEDDDDIYENKKKEECKNQ